MKNWNTPVSVLLALMLTACSSKPNNSPVILVAAFDSGPGAAILTFRADSTCEWIAGMMGSPQIGKYHIQDSLIDIEGINLEGALKSKHLLLTKRNPNNNQLHFPILLQTNASGAVIDSHFVFTVTMDRR